MVEKTKRKSELKSVSSMTPKAGAMPIEMVLPKPKYPTPSPRRDEGMMSTARAAAKVVPRPKPSPCMMRAIISMCIDVKKA